MGHLSDIHQSTCLFGEAGRGVTLSRQDVAMDDYVTSSCSLRSGVV